MINKLLYVFVFCFVPSALQAQEKNEFLFLGNITVGKSLPSDQPIVAQTYKFNDEIYSMTLAPRSQKEIILLRSKVLVCDLSSSRTHLEIKSQGEPFLSYNNNALILSKMNSTIMASTECYSLHNGKRLWNKGRSLNSFGFYTIFVDSKSPTIVGVDSYFLKGVDAMTGKEIWKKNISKRDAGIPYYRHINDSTLLIISGGLHAVNIYTGKGWDYDIKTSDNSFKREVISYSISSGGGLIPALIAELVRGTKKLDYGDINIEGDIIMYNNETELVKLSATDGAIMEKRTITANPKKNSKDNLIEYWYKDLRFEVNDNKISVYNSNSALVANIVNLTRFIFANENFIYLAKDKSIYKIDISQFN